MANARKSVAHVFNENPDSLEFNELVFDNYMDMLTDLDKDSLISLIKKEAETQAAEIESDLEGLNQDKNNLTGALQKVQEKWDEFNQIASSLATKQAKLREELQKLELAASTQSNNISSTRN